MRRGGKRRVKVIPKLDARLTEIANLMCVVNAANRGTGGQHHHQTSIRLHPLPFLKTGFLAIGVSLFSPGDQEPLSRVHPDVLGLLTLRHLRMATVMQIYGAFGRKTGRPGEFEWPWAALGLFVTFGLA